MLTGEVKKRLADVLTELVERHRLARSAVTDEVSFLCTMAKLHSTPKSTIYIYIYIKPSLGAATWGLLRRA